jgi:glycosyltransferase involved in cell wall biosynthesis
MIPLSVIICTYNPKREFLVRVLAALRRQTLPLADWELLVVDNNSTPPIRDWLTLEWHPAAQIIEQPRPGLTHARLAGGHRAKADLLVLVDDDNVLAENYLAQALQIAADHPHLGAWGGNCVPEFEIPPPAEIAPHLAALGINNVRGHLPQWSNFRDTFRTVPMGGGMCLRKAVFAAYQNHLTAAPHRAEYDRTGAILRSGSDWDMAMTAVDIGLGTGVFPALHLTHLIKRERLSLDYLEALHFGIGYSMTWIRHYRGILKVPYLETRLAAWLSAFREPPIARRLQRAERKGFAKAWAEIRALPK